MNINRKRVEIDATDMAPGRLATKIAVVLIGKDKTDFVSHLDMGGFVTVLNVDKIKFTGKKLEQKKYYRHSGYPGGVKTTLAKKMIKEKPEHLIRLTVYNMLPKNTLRTARMKRLSFKS